MPRTSNSRTTRSTRCWRSMSPRSCRTRPGLPPRCAASAFPAARSFWSTISRARTGRCALWSGAWRIWPAISGFMPISRSTISSRKAGSQCARSGRATCSATGGCCAASTKSRPPICPERAALVPGIDLEKMTDRLAAIAEPVRRDGYAFVRAPEMRALLEGAGLRDWDGFAASWDDLGVDTYMADGGRYRRRRFACFRATKEAIARKPHQPHYQSRDYNPLNGGIERWFDPVTDPIGAHPAMQAVLTTCRELFDP